MKSFEALKIHYAWLHSYDNQGLGDIDIVIDPDKFDITEILIQNFLKGNDFKLLQVFQHEYCAKYFVLGKISGIGSVEYLIPDICSDYVRNGRVLIKAKQLLEDRVYGEGFYKCSPLIEAEYVFLKRCLKENWETKHFKDFRNIFLFHKEEMIIRLKKYLDIDLLEIFSSTIENGDLLSLNHISSNLRVSILQKTRQQDPGGFLYYKINDIRRIIKRIINPTGLFIAVIGTDGSGKSTVIQELSTILEPAFRKIKKYHWKPGVFTENNDENIIVDEPHKQPPRSFILSIIKILVYTAEYLFGFFLKILPQKIKSTLVVFDRYYYDILVDRRRFRMKIPLKIVELLLPFIPKPDMVFFLKTQPEIALKRKNELSITELERQSENFALLGKKIKKNFFIIENDTTVNNAVYEITKIIFDFLENRIKDKSEFATDYNKND